MEKNSLAAVSYRKDIDGLRAVAVLGVVLFHAKLQMPGGFCGVDVFFVISGYLLSSLIIREINEEQFSFLHFWERRICRILPAALVVTGVSLLLGWFLYLPEDFVILAQSASAQAAALANFFFWRQPDGYFDGLDTQPLLHFWSLAVEEQFYFLLPLLLAWVAKRGATLRVTLVGLSLGSFTLSVLASQRYPMASFYLLPTRGWELLLGGVLATTPRLDALPTWSREAAGVCGVGLIGFAFLRFNADMVFPGGAALVPCTGTALILLSSTGSVSMVGRLLSLRPLVFVGLLSYSIYLWHWPFLAIPKYLLGDQPWPVRLAMVAASFLFAYLSWRFIETPFRYVWKHGSQRRVFRGAALSALVALLIAVGAGASEGFPQRFSPVALKYAAEFQRYPFRETISEEQARHGDFPVLGLGRDSRVGEILLWGDSHAMAIAPALDRLGRKHGRALVVATWHGTPPVSHFAGKSKKMEDRSEAVLSYIEKNKVQRVVMAAHWKSYARSKGFAAALESTLKRIRKAGAKVYLLECVPDHGLHVSRVASLLKNYGGNLDERLQITVDQHREANREVASTLSRHDSDEVVLLKPEPYFLNDQGNLRAHKEGQLLYRDATHLSRDGAFVLEPLLELVFE